MNANATLNSEIEALLADINGSWAGIKSLPGQVEELRSELREARRTSLSAAQRRAGRPIGGVSDACALALAGQFIIMCERSGKLPALAENTRERDALLDTARNALGITTRTAISITEIPLPQEFHGELRELISEFGVCRRHMTPYPIGRGTAKPPRMGARPAFASVTMSAAVPEKSPSITFASLESHKIGGLVRLPREIDEQSSVAMGQFLARYGGIEFARAEDTWGFLADGQASYESVKGIVQIAKDGGRTIVLATGKTKPSDVTLADLRNLRTVVNKAALSGRVSAYYFDSTWEPFLAGLNTSTSPNVYMRLPSGAAVLDGYPIVWTDVLQPYGTSAAADKPCVVFGALGFWWFGEHGSPRIDTNDSVFFANDQLAVRFIEEIDFDYCDAAATGALLTAAS